MNYKPVIGLEVHVELKTKSKMFCGCSADYFGKKPNTHTCPVCLGLPGALPVPNKTAIEWCIKIGLALNCDIQLFSKFDRKNYFYPDLPKGYQISQYDQPFCVNGSIEISDKKKMIRIRRVHMEEDTGKLIHKQGSTLIDFNRSGVPLVEIVTEPDFQTAEEVVEYLKKLQQIVRYLNVSNADMEKGDMRLEPNISLREIRNPKSEIRNDELPKYKIEVKNINSFKFVDKAIAYEIKRQTEILDSGQKPQQETRGWDENKQKTVSQRVKEEANDYRYFPEPDIPPFQFDESYIASINCDMPELPDSKFYRFTNIYLIPSYDAEILSRDRQLAEYFDEAVDVGRKHTIKPKQIANTIINKKIDITQILPAQLVESIVSNQTTIQISEDELKKLIQEALDAHPEAVTDYKSGKLNSLMFLLGQVMKKDQKLDAKIVREKLENMLQ